MGNERRCPVCTAIIRGRSDKVYCDAYCKNEGHQANRLLRRKATLHIDQCLHRNHKLMSSFLKEKNVPVKVSRSELKQLQFNFTYHTHSIVNAKGQKYYCIYDLAWLSLSENIILIVRQLAT